jgi:putative membrane protein
MASRLLKLYIDFKTINIMKGKLRWMLALLVLILGVNACDDDDDDNNNGNGNDHNLSTEDRDFMRDAGLANLAEIQMGQLMLDSADSTNDSTVVAFATRMVGEHTTAWTELQNLADDKDVDLPNEPDQDQQDQMDYLMTLNGHQLDSAYISSQVDAHQATATLFQKAVANNEDDNDVRAYAVKYLPGIQQHLTDAITLRDSIATQTRIRLHQ